MGIRIGIDGGGTKTLLRAMENGQLLVEVQNLEADGSVTSQWAAIDYLEGESVS